MQKAFNEMHGKIGNQAQKIFDEWVEKMNKAQAEFDAKEGELHVEFKGPAGNAGPATDVKTGPISKK